MNADIKWINTVLTFALGALIGMGVCLWLNNIGPDTQGGVTMSSIQDDIKSGALR